MINTDKYEGHTPGPWRQAKPKDSNPRITTQFCGDEIIVNTGATSWEADVQLIADAPLLLEEVKQIHEILREAFTNAPRHSAGDYLNMLARVTGLIE